MAVLTAFGTVCGEAALAQEPAAPIRMSASYVSDILSNVRGGSRKGSALLGKLDVAFEAQGDGAGVWAAEAYLDVQHVHGRALSGELVGDAQGVSNIEAQSALRAYEAWISVPVGPKNLAVRAGLIDLNSEFDVQSTGAFFVNSSHGIGPEFSQTGHNGPSIFPTTATGAILRAGEDRWHVSVGVFDALAGDAADPRRTVLRWPGGQGFLQVGEVKGPIGPNVTLQLGGWRYTKTFEAIDGKGRDRSQGAYTIAEAQWSVASGFEASAWVRAGLATSDVNPIGTYVGGGMTLERGRNKFGIAVAHARLGSPALNASVPGNARLDRAETNLEISYRYQVNDRIGIQPDLQYVINPGWEPTRRDAVVVGVRLQLTLK